MACMAKADCRMEHVCPHLLFRHHLLDSPPPKTVGRTRTLHFSDRSITTGNVPTAFRGRVAESVLQIAADVVRFTIPVILHGLRGLHLYFPAVPSLPLDFPIAQFFTEKPLSALGWWPAVHLFIYPSIIAIVYLLTLEISFSFWFFFLLGKMETVLIYATGSKVNQWNFHQNQQMGALLVFIGFILFIGKRHFGRAFATIFGIRGWKPLPPSTTIFGIRGWKPSHQAMIPTNRYLTFGRQVV